MKLGRFSKSPVERKRYTIDYSNWLDTGETVVSRSFTVTPSTASQLYVDGDGLGSPATSIYFYVNAGLDQTDYTVDVRVVTSGGQTKEDTFTMSVRSQP